MLNVPVETGCKGVRLFPISELSLASFSKRVLVLILPCQKEIPFSDTWVVVYLASFWWWGLRKLGFSLLIFLSNSYCSIVDSDVKPQQKTVFDLKLQTAILWRVHWNKTFGYLPSMIDVFKFAISQSKAMSTALVSCNIKSLTWHGRTFGS